MDSGSLVNGAAACPRLSHRHPDFDRAARDYIRSMGDPEPSKDDVQAQRQRTYRSTRDWMAQARFAIVRQRYRGTVPCQPQATCS